MGYYMTERECNFIMKQSKLEEAFKYAHKKLCDERQSKGRGGSYSGGKIEEVWYSWVDNTELKNAQTVRDLIKCFGWYSEIDENGNIAYLGFNSDKIGQEDLLFEALAPFVEEGSYIEMSGEDGALWRWVFKNGHCNEVNAKVSWED